MDDRARVKKDLRATMRSLRDGLGAQERERIDSFIAQRVCNLPEYLGAHSVFTYLSVGAEVDTRAIIRDAWRRGKLVAVPRCVPGTSLMEWHVIEDFESLEPGSFGIQEPADDPATLVAVPGADAGGAALAVVPGYSFDGQGFRLGYGGGFYDAFLPTFGGYSVGLCRSAQFSECELPRYESDVPVDAVATEGRLVIARESACATAAR